MTVPDDQERISKLRALLEAEGQPAPAGGAGSAPGPRRADATGGPARSPLVMAVGAAAVIAVAVVVLLAIGGDSGVKQPDDTTAQRVSVFPTRIVGGVEKGDRVTFCDNRAGGTVASNVVVFDRSEVTGGLNTRTVVLDVYIPNDLVSRFQGKGPAEFAVVRGTCGEVATTTTATTATTAPPETAPVTTAPANPSVPTQPPDQGGSQ